MIWTCYPKPVIMSEFGGDAKAGLHGDATVRWTEEFQANLYEHQFVMLNQIAQLRAMCPWVLTDFRSLRRQLPGIQDNFNRGDSYLTAAKRKRRSSFCKRLTAKTVSATRSREIPDWKRT